MPTTASSTAMTSLNMRELSAKFSNPDPDIRYMSLVDVESFLCDAKVSAHLNSDFYGNETSLLGRELINLLGDQIGEVQNQALKCFGPLAARSSTIRKAFLLFSLCSLTPKPETDDSLQYSALRSVVAAMHHPQTGGAITTAAAEDYKAVQANLLTFLTDGNAKKNIPALLAKNGSKGYSSDAIDLARDVIKAYGVCIAPPDVEKLTGCIVRIIRDDGAGTVATKRALLAVSDLVGLFNDTHWGMFLSEIKNGFAMENLSIRQRRNLTSTIAMAARGDPAKLGSYLYQLAEDVLAPVYGGSEKKMYGMDKAEDDYDPNVDEVRETALATLDTLLTLCAKEMKPYVVQCATGALNYLRYDPNLAINGDSDDEEMGDADGAGSDAEEEDGEEFSDFEDVDESDTDDVSWKVRRAAAKLLCTLVSSQECAAVKEFEEMVYGKVAPALLARLAREREDTVKLEIVSCLIALVRRSAKATGQSVLQKQDEELIPFDTSERARSSRKRRRQHTSADELEDEDPANDVDYEAQMAACPASFIRDASPVVSRDIRDLEPEEEKGSDKQLTALIPSLVKSLIAAWKTASVALKTSELELLRSIALSSDGALADFYPSIATLVVDALHVVTDASAAVSGFMNTNAAGMRVEGLLLVGTIAATARKAAPDNQDALVKFLVTIVPGVVDSVVERNVKVAVEAFTAVERIVRALTPSASPDAHSTSAQPAQGEMHTQARGQLETLFDTIVSRITDSNVDRDVRVRAIHVLGVLIGRTSGVPGDAYLGPQLRQKGLQVLLDCARNELTRLAAIRAVDDVVVYARAPDDTPRDWTLAIAAELAAQLRKADRVLRAAALDALRGVVVNTHCRAHLDDKAVLGLSANLMQLLDGKERDLHMLTPALIIYGKIVPGHAEVLVSDEFIGKLCDVVRGNGVSGMTLKALLLLVRILGEQGAGGRVLTAFLRDVGVQGDPGVLGRAIGTLLVHGGQDLPVKAGDFSSELASTPDPARKCLALAVLGEVGLRMGSRSSLEPEAFLGSFNSSSDKVRLSAAVALGSAGATNVKVYLPIILDGLQKTSGLKYLLLHSLREILQHPAAVREELRPFAETLWQTLLSASEQEDNRVVGAECIGRMALIEPRAYVSRLKDYLSDNSPAIRGTVISAFRYTLSDRSDAYRAVMKPLLIPILHTMLEDPDLGNHRLALTTVNSAMIHQLDLIEPNLHVLVMLIIEDTKIRPELVREVQMGPFRHKVDDGLDLRKAAYEALYTSIDVAFPTINVQAAYARIIAGIEDHGDIRSLSLLMIAKLAALDPAETRNRLNALAEQFTKVMAAKPANNAVKQDIEREQEASNGILRVGRALLKMVPVPEGTEFEAWKEFAEKYLKLQ
ncbi:hypothetical protein KEM55_004827 [Ascosphaera atra]|nr:hypothetical protein KEM55_004827 [Ascosphaera atra]